MSPPDATDTLPLPNNNGLVHVFCQIMRQVMVSAVEANLGELSLNAQSICPIHTALEELGHVHQKPHYKFTTTLSTG